MKRADSYGRIGNCDVLLNYQRTQFSLFPEEPGARDHKEVQNMNKYELAVVVSAKIEDDARAAVIEKVKEMITRFGGNVTDVDEWGKRRCGLIAQSLAHDMFQDGLHGLDGRLFGNLFPHHFRWKLHDGLPVFDHPLHEARAHHLAVVGDGVIESQCRDGWYLRFVAYAHPRQGRVAPVVVLAM